MNTNHKAIQPGTQRLPLMVAMTLIATIASMAIAAGCRPPSRAIVRTELKTVTMVNAYDDSGGRGEEPYFGVIKFRTTVGVPGSTSAWVVTDPNSLDLDVGELYPSSGPVPIPADPGQETSHISRQATAETVSTNGMTLNGTIIVGLEHDKRGWSPALGIEGILDKLRGLTDDLETELAVLETLPWFPGLLSVFQDKIEAFVADAPRDLGGNEGRDDIIGVHIIVNVGASLIYYSQMRPALDNLGVAKCDGSYLMTPPQDRRADYRISVCPDHTQTLNLLFEGGPGRYISGQWVPTSYEVRVDQTFLTGVAATNYN